MYGGLTELGVVEVTLDDCWSIDLSRRDRWRCVLPGTMHTLVWRGENDDGTEVCYQYILRYMKCLDCQRHGRF